MDAGNSKRNKLDKGNKEMKKQSAIKTCPFCGCKPKLSSNHSSTTPLIVSSFEANINCRSGRCKVHPSLTGYNRFAHTKEEKQQVVEQVIKQWNTRK